MYFFVSLTVLSRRAWRNMRVTATVTLFIILLDTTCQMRASACELSAVLRL
jgi:hypothetical protein